MTCTMSAADKGPEPRSASIAASFHVSAIASSLSDTHGRGGALQRHQCPDRLTWGCNRCEAWVMAKRKRCNRCGREIQTPGVISGGIFCKCPPPTPQRQRCNRCGHSLRQPGVISGGIFCNCPPPAPQRQRCSRCGHSLRQPGVISGGIFCNCPPPAPQRQRCSRCGRELLGNRISGGVFCTCPPLAPPVPRCKRCGGYTDGRITSGKSCRCPSR
jgi:hypothetical protein